MGIMRERERERESKRRFAMIIVSEVIKHTMERTSLIVIASIPG